MRHSLILAGLAAAVALPVLATPHDAAAACSDRRVAGTVIGGVAGGLLGNSISRGGGGAIVGGIGGALLGNSIASSGCNRAYRRTAYYRQPSQRSYAAAPRAVRYVYYDQYGQPVSSGPAPVVATTTAPRYVQASYSSACRTESRSFYDDRGVLQTRPYQVCSR